MQTFAHTQEFTHSHTLVCSLLTTRWQYSSLLLAFFQGLLLPLSSSPPANFIIIMFLIIPESQRKRHAVLHFLGSQVQRQCCDRLQSERRLLTTECRRDQMGLHRGESVSFCLGEGGCMYLCVRVCSCFAILTQTTFPHNSWSRDVFLILVSLRTFSGLGYLRW